MFSAGHLVFAAGAQNLYEQARRVHPDRRRFRQRRSGAGSLLLQAAENRLRQAGSRAVGLETAVDNLPALSFYKRHGYNLIRTWPRYYSNGVDALVLRKELT